MFSGDFYGFSMLFHSFWVFLRAETSLLTDFGFGVALVSKQKRKPNGKPTENKKKQGWMPDTLGVSSGELYPTPSVSNL